MTALLLSTYLGYVSVLNRCHNFDCKVLKRFKNQDCKIHVVDNTATVFGTSYPMKLSVQGSVNIWTGWNGNLFLSMHFRRRDGRLIRSYISEYSTKSDYRRWTCEMPGMEGVSDW